MSTGQEDRLARSLALEKTYVHDAYEQMSALQCTESKDTPAWPTVTKFISELEPGSIVCDVGCGSGKYLKVNPSIFKIGGDRCKRLATIAKEGDNEVLFCDNLALPFRDETFDAVLSIAVIHHFTTKERRVVALRELTRVLRIGGRLMITAWAMDNADLRCTTQDVLIQWRTPSNEFLTSNTSEEDFVIPYQMSQSHAYDDADSLLSGSGSLKRDNQTGRSRLRLFQSLRSIKTSPSSSSLSSPNETCYSFVRKALQKLSRSSKKDKNRSRTWFLDTWTYRDDHLPATRYDPEGCEENTDVLDLPIELIGMDEDSEPPKKDKSSSMQLLDVNLNQKSKSLNDILLHASTSTSINRSRSGIMNADGYKVKIKTNVTEGEMDTLKPKLVKQKKSICEDDFENDEERDKATDMKKLVKELPMFKISMERPEKFNVLKQKSLTEDIMSADRLREKEKVRQNIQKQASLNEDLIYRRHRTLDTFKDAFLTNPSKKFQMLRSGLTSKFKSSTSIEKVTGASIKSGFAKIFHNLTSSEQSPADPVQPLPSRPGVRKSSSEDRGDDYLNERRCSHEENSDSSKDNSLQSDTSVDSEDSIISVIERIKPDATSPTVLTSPGPHSPKRVFGGGLSHPSSPKISQISQYPATKAKALSLPASPRTIVLSPSIKQAFKMPSVHHISSNGNGTAGTPNGKVITPKIENGIAVGHENQFNGNHLKLEEEPIIKLSPMKQVTAAKMKSHMAKDLKLLSEKLAILQAKETEPRGDVCEGDESQKADAEHSANDRLKKEDVAKLKSGTFLKNTLPSAKKIHSSSLVTFLAHQNRLQSYELFNPEIEDIDTDSSGVSTPDSVGSVISVKMDSSNGNNTPVGELGQEAERLLPEDLVGPSKECSISSLPIPLIPLKTDHEDHDKYEPILELSESASSLEDTEDEKESTSHTTSKGKEKLSRTYPSLAKSPEDATWDKECRQYIVDLAENLSERLIAEIDRYKEQNVTEKEHPSFSAMEVQDPYLTKLSEDLSHVSKLTKELSEDLEPETEFETETDIIQSAQIKQMDSVEEISDVILEEKDDSNESSTEKTKGNLISEASTDAESPLSISCWLDSRRNTIESGFLKEDDSREEEKKEQKIKVTNTEEFQQFTIFFESDQRKLSQSEIPSQTRLSIESTDTVDVSERTVSSSDDSKRDATQTETSSGFSAESDLYDFEKFVEPCGKPTEKLEYIINESVSQISLLRPGESMESSDAGDISERTASVSDFSRQNTETRSVRTQSSASLTSWSDCSKDIRFADRRTNRCDGRSSSEETNPRAVLIRQQAATKEPPEIKRVSPEAIVTCSSCKTCPEEEVPPDDPRFPLHHFYHLFRQGELDAMIGEFVENLHIISSYYDHKNWCIIAEKVRVWTI